MEEPMKGRAFKFGEDINTDLIIPARYLNTSDPDELAKHCMVDEREDFPSVVKPGDIIVAGKNLGCGSSREHAPIAIKASGIACVIASSFARIFYRNSFNIGLPLFESPQAAAAIDEGDEIEVISDTGEIKNLTKNETYKAQPLPRFMKELLEAGGLMEFVKKKFK